MRDLSTKDLKKLEKIDFDKLPNLIRDEGKWTGKSYAKAGENTPQRAVELLKDARPQKCEQRNNNFAGTHLPPLLQLQRRGTWPPGIREVAAAAHPQPYLQP